MVRLLGVIMKNILKYIERLGIALSVLVNVILGGPSNQTFSARNWEWSVSGRYNLVWLIDFLASWYENNHCERSWNFWATRFKNRAETRYETADNIEENHYDYQ